MENAGNAMALCVAPITGAAHAPASLQGGTVDNHASP